MFDLSPAAADDASDLSLHPIHSIPPVGDPYVLGRWHKGQITLRGVAREAVVKLRLSMRGAVDDPDKFLIFGRPRSGSTLLARLLGQVHGLRCTGEMLNYVMREPQAYLDGLARLSGAAVFGSKVLSYQLLEIQRLDPWRFFNEMAGAGYTLIHLRRNTFDQALSLSLAQATGHYHRMNGDRKVPMPAQIDIPQADFAAQYRWNAAMLDYEDALMSRLPHVTINYETDLAQARMHQPAIDMICGRLGLPPSTVKADMRRIGGPNGIVRARNAVALRVLVGAPALPVRLAG